MATEKPDLPKEVKFDRRKEDKKIERSHRDTLRAVAVAFLVTILAVAAWAFADQLRATKSDRAGCERLNNVRASTGDLERSLISASKQRIQVEPDPAIKKVIQTYLDRYREDYAELVDSAQEFRIAPGSLMVSCSRAYPYPWPLD